MKIKPNSETILALLLLTALFASAGACKRLGDDVRESKEAAKALVGDYVNSETKKELLKQAREVLPKNASDYVDELARSDSPVAKKARELAEEPGEKTLERAKEGMRSLADSGMELFRSAKSRLPGSWGELVRTCDRYERLARDWLEKTLGPTLRGANSRRRGARDKKIEPRPPERWRVIRGRS